MIGEDKDRILIVDDDPTAISIIRHTLSNEPYELFIALSGQDGLDILSVYDDIKVVISDENMPGMSGSEFLAKVKESYPFVVRILMTGLKLSGTAMRAVSSGAVYRIIKKVPWNSFDVKMNIFSAVKKYDQVAGTITLQADSNEEEPSVDGLSLDIDRRDKAMDKSPGLPKVNWKRKEDPSD
jgi:DNA-binding NtrC family response regulator